MKGRRKKKSVRKSWGKCLFHFFFPTSSSVLLLFPTHREKKGTLTIFSFISDVRYMCGSSGWSRRGCENGIESLNCIKKRRVGVEKWWMENTTVEGKDEVKKMVEKCYAAGVLSSSLWCCFCFSFKRTLYIFKLL